MQMVSGSEKWFLYLKKYADAPDYALYMGSSACGDAMPCRVPQKVCKWLQVVGRKKMLLYLKKYANDHSSSSQKKKLILILYLKKYANGFR